MNFTINFYQDSVSHDCSYLADRQARNIYPDPNLPMDRRIYSQLIQHGFRRSGNHVYRPHCPACEACVPVRINVKKFKTNRSQRRCLRRNHNVIIREETTAFNSEHYALYQRYINTRHPDGGMENPTEESYNHFISSYWCDTQLIEFREQSTLIAVAVTDVIDDGFSAFYTFFDPDYGQRSLGTYSILKQIELAAARDLPYVYLGYWIKECQKMRYKQAFSALEGYLNGQWQSIET